MLPPPPDPALAVLLPTLRAARGFDPVEVAEAKVGRLNHWFSEQGLDAAVLGLSGGVDSALALALLRAAQDRPGSPLRRVVALLLPVESPGATGQGEATAAGRAVAQALGAEIWEAPLGAALRATVDALAEGSGLGWTAWAEGQVCSLIRTPALYGAAALLQAQGHRSVVVGTTNRDEGAYLGFFGKASDGMVDLQPLSDLHKSEVRALAAHLGVPRAVVEATPSGGVWDGRSDEEMIGCSYDAVEAVLRLRECGLDPAASLPQATAAVERHHRVNRHKYAAGHPAVHLDVLPRGVPGGWPDAPLAGRGERRPPAEATPGAWDPPEVTLDPPKGLPVARTVLGPPGLVFTAAVLTPGDCARLIAALRTAGVAEPVGVTGLRGAYGIGSVRATAWSEALAGQLWRRLKPVIPAVRFCTNLTPTDAFATPTRAGHRSWRAVGLSPLLRFMRYDPGGEHWGHYDAGFDYGDGRRTLLSVVYYLTDAPGSGATRFLRDGQEGRPMDQRDLGDWDRPARDDEVLARVFPRVGEALVFDHRLPHDVARWEGPGPRLIIRADVVYEAIPDGRTP